MKKMITPESPYWDIVQRLPDDRHRRAVWKVRCKQCRRSYERRHIEVKEGRRLCSICYPHPRSRIMLTAQGRTMTIAGWLKAFPNLVRKEATIRSLLSHRSAGREPYVNWTDADILFGKGKEPALGDADMELPDSVILAFAEDISVAVRRIAFDFVDNEFRRSHAQLIEQRRIDDQMAGIVETAQLACAGLIVEDIDISEQVLEGVPSSVAWEAYLEPVRFESLQDKIDLLQAFIPVDTNVPDRITPLEAMALFSLLPRVDRDPD